MEISGNQNERYRRIVENIDQLPSLPAIVTRLIQVINSPDSSAEDAASLIERDPALTGKMLRLANSAFYGIPRTISSVSSAVVILGFNTIKSLVLSASVMKLFPESVNARTFDRARFWRHSIVCAMAARSLVKSLMPGKMMDPESAFCAGILHDIGKLVFEQYAQADYCQACETARNAPASLINAEMLVMGIDHSGVGRILADKWALPLELEHSIVSHHDLTASGPTADLIAAVHLADALTHQIGVDLWDGEQPAPVLPQAYSMLRISDSSFQQVRSRIEEEIAKSDEFLSILEA